MTLKPSYLNTPNHPLAYVRHSGNGAGVLFLTGFKSDMQGAKALALDSWCQEQGRPFVRFDYSGHGQSGGEFEQGTIGQWHTDALSVFDALTEGPQVVVGSSMGGWLALLLALKRPGRVKGMVLLAPAPDFTERLIWQQSKPEQRAEMEKNGKIAVPNCYGTEPYIITKQLIEEGREHLLLGGPINIHCPVRIMHGIQDEDVPWEMSIELTQRLASEDVKLTLIKDAGHRLSEPENLALLCRKVGEL